MNIDRAIKVANELLKVNQYIQSWFNSYMNIRKESGLPFNYPENFHNYNLEAAKVCWFL